MIHSTLKLYTKTSIKIHKKGRNLIAPGITSLPEPKQNKIVMAVGWHIGLNYAQDYQLYRVILGVKL